MQQEEEKKNEAYKEELNFDKPDYSFVPSGVHHYKQQGPYLVCQTCELKHAVYIGMEKIMVGEDKKGQPILKSKKEVFG